MISLLSTIVFVFSFWVGKIVYKKKINPISFYAFIWCGMIFLYGLRLIPFSDLTSESWTLIILSYFSFFCGAILVYAFYNLNGNLELYKWQKKDFFIFVNDGKYLNLAIIILGSIGLIAAIQHWLHLLNQYGSIAEVFIHAPRVYRYRIDNKDQGAIPFLWLFSYVAIFLAGIFTAYKKKITIGAVIAIIGLSLKSLATFTRSGVLFGLLEFVFAFILFNNIFVANNKRQSSIKKILGSLILILILISTTSVVRLARTGMDSHFSQGASSSLRQFENGLIISPAVYFYLASQIVVFSKYLEDDFPEKNLFGESTFFPIYRFIGKFDLVEKPDFRSKGYYTPFWSNTSTYLGNLHKDFGYTGVLLFPFFLGLFITHCWYKLFLNGNIYYIITLTFLFIIIGMSFFALQLTVIWWVGLIFSFIVFTLLKNINIVTS